jgi:hypothetical protein
MSNGSAVLCRESEMPAPGPVRLRHLRIPPGDLSRKGIFPFRPVFDLFWPNELPRKSNGVLPDYAISSIALRLGVDRQYIHRWFHRGLDDMQADTIATMLGLHPCALWPDWFVHAPDEDQVRQAERLQNMARTPRERRLVALRGAGMSHQAIARIMTSEGQLTPSYGRIWSAATVASSFGTMRRAAA